MPAAALTVGLRTLLDARELLMLVSGAAKAEALGTMLEGPQDPDCPASLLRDHPGLTVICDAAAAFHLQPLPGVGERSGADRARTPRARWSAEGRLSDESLARLQTAPRRTLTDRPRVVIFTGYSHRPAVVSEAEQMKSAWDQSQVPTLLEVAGRNTAENASRSLPIVRALGAIRRVTVVTSAWHIRAPYFFAPYRLLGLRLSFRFAWHPTTSACSPRSLRACPGLRRQRRRALAEMRPPPETGCSR